MENSKFKKYSIGTVAEDLITGNKAIKVYPHEQVTMLEGDINQTIDTNKQAKDSSGKSYNVTMTEGATITATWLNPNSNRVTPPNVRKGELVQIYKYEDINRFYWTTLGNELDIRGLEHVEYAYVNDPEAKEITDANSYKVIYSTLNKLVGLRTTDNNGEATTYEKMLDTKEGIDILVLDGFGNTIVLNSKAGEITINTNAVVNIITNVANITATESTNIKTGKMTIISDQCSINP